MIYKCPVGKKKIYVDKSIELFGLNPGIRILLISINKHRQGSTIKLYKRSISKIKLSLILTKSKRKPLDILVPTTQLIL